jgi:hypothetical protein
MRQGAYVLQFTGKAVPANEAGTVLNASLSALPCVITTTGDSGAVEGIIRTTAGPRSKFESKVTFTSDTTFQEDGMITFPIDATLFVSQP